MKQVVVVFYIVSFFAIFLNSIQGKWLPAISCLLTLILLELVQIQYVLKNKYEEALKGESK